jgi:Domain of unknown function (DUF5658)
MFRSLPSLLAGTFVALVAMQSSATAQDLVAANTTTVLFPAIAPLVPAPATAVAAPAAEAVSTPIFTRPTMHAEKSIGRPSMLPALYVAQGALQAMDMHSTMQAISRGAHEANPLMQGVVGNKGAMMAVKAGVAVSTILMSECLWKKGNRTGAIVSMIVANSVTAVVVAHNYRLSNQLAH